MKKTLLLVLLACTLQGQAQSNNVTREGNTFRTTTTATTAKTTDTKTKYTWQSAKGEEYPIYLSKNGHAYVIRTSRNTGKTYRKYLGEDISRTICKEVGVKYI